MHSLSGYSFWKKNGCGGVKVTVKEIQGCLVMSEGFHEARRWCF
jgi:hypothetical protein